MNNKLFALAIAGSLALASCSNEVRTTENDEVMTARIDSAVNARMAEMQARLAAQNDSLINAMAMMRADSMMAAAAGNNTSARRTAPSRPSTTPRSTTTPTNTGSPRTEQDRKFENRENGNSSGQTISPEKAKEQDDKFNRRGGN